MAVSSAVTVSVFLGASELEVGVDVHVAAKFFLPKRDAEQGLSRLVLEVKGGMHEVGKSAVDVFELIEGELAAVDERHLLEGARRAAAVVLDVEVGEEKDKLVVRD